MEKKGVSSLEQFNKLWKAMNYGIAERND